MENITTYTATKKNIFLWIAALLSVCSVLTRLIFAFRPGEIESGHPIIFVLIPIIASLVIAIRLPLRGDKQFYVSILPVFLLSFYALIAGKNAIDTTFMTMVFVVGVIIFAGLYFLTFIGKLHTKFIVLAYLVAVLAVLGINSASRSTILGLLTDRRWLAYSDITMVFSVLFLILSAKKLPPYQEGEPYRLRFGDRLDGRRIHNMPLMSKVTPHFMPNRLNRSNYISDSIEITRMEEYIRGKRREGYSQFGITHVILAAYIRTTAEMPELNRFVAGQKIYHRFETSANMTVKKEMKKEAPDSAIKVYFSPEDTAVEVYEKFLEALEIAKTEGITNGFDKITHVFDYIPSLLLSGFGWLIRFLDYFAILPSALEKVSPFHGSLFITSMGSLAIPPIYHHLYDIGNVPVFCAFGHKYTKHELDKNNEPVTRKYMDYKIVCDEGICDGYYYAVAMKKFKNYMSRPEKLDLPPETVKEDIF